ncbi:MAG: undecaprenyl-diphosphate phosphatase [Patescibacteria group bacterium]
MDFIQATIIGIIEGLTEFLPVSSTAHMIIGSKLMGINSSEFTKTFEIVIQLGAILAVVMLYIKQLLNWQNIKKLIVAFIPTAIIGFTLYKLVKSYLMENLTIIVWALIIGGIILIIFEKFYAKKDGPEEDSGIQKISYKQCLYIGLFQSLAIIPGVSRSAATIIGGLTLGLKRKTIVEFSFLLAVPTMIAASGLDLIQGSGGITTSQFKILGLGFIVAFIVGGLSVKFFLKYIQKHNFIPFGIYRIIIGLALLLFLI